MSDGQEKLQKKSPSRTPKVKEKMRKAQLQLAILKKKQCDAIALTIVERLLEHNIDEQWLLQNLKYINRSHMEDVIEERAISKTCGYVLCDKPLTLIVNQRYHISTKINKVFDISKRKNFCSSCCYGASKYLLEQMLTSPLWLRDKEEIPDFQILPAKLISQRSTAGEEVLVNEAKLEVDKERNVTVAEKLVDILKYDVEENELNNIHKHEIQENESNSVAKYETQEENEFNNISKHKTQEKESNSVSNCETQENESNDDIKIETMNVHLEKEIVNNRNVSERETKIPCELSRDCLYDKDKAYVSDSENCSEENNSNNSEKQNSSEIQKPEAIENIENNELRLQINKKSKKEVKVQKRKEMVEVNPDELLVNLIKKVEENFKEWITENTIKLLSGDAEEKQEILESVENREKYTALCEKLNRLQLKEEQEDRETLNNELRAMPHFSVLREQGKKLELKVHAFYKGSCIIDPQENREATEQDNNDYQLSTVLPLTEAQAPHALRRRIFLDKLQKILPDLLSTLAGNRRSLSPSYFNEKFSIIKALVSTFSLSAKNIVFRSAEWTLVGLVMIKMLGLIDPHVKTLQATKQASMYTTMILMSYKLDQYYLDRLVATLIDR